MSRMDPITRRLLAWYARHQRPFPWRGERDPYRIWVSEVMLQQTQAVTAIPYYRRFVARWRNIRALAAARLDDVLKVWEGLGYYARARNLHTGAQAVVRDFGGRLPRDVATLRTIPGIGRYTAGAIASMAFGLDEPTVDANIQRVISRLFAVRQEVRSAAGRNSVWTHAREILPAGAAGDFNQALMDLGASICSPRKPNCAACPVRSHCKAYQEGRPERYPVIRAQTLGPERHLAVPVIFRRGRVLIARRRTGGLLGGMWEFSGGAIAPGESPRAACRRAAAAELGVRVRLGDPLGTVKHAFSHFHLTLHIFRCEYVSGEPCSKSADRVRWAYPRELDRFAWSSAHRRIVAMVQETA